MTITRQEDKGRFLIKEYELISTKISSLYQAGPTIITVGLTVVGGIMLYGLEKKIEIALYFLPIASFFPVLIALTYYTEEKCLAAYKKYLEEKINNWSGQKIVFWESEIAPKRHRDFAKFTLYIIYICFLCVSVYLGLSHAWQTASRPVFFALLTLSTLLAVGTVIAAIRLESSFKGIYNLCKANEDSSTRKPRATGER